MSPIDPEGKSESADWLLIEVVGRQPLTPGGATLRIVPPNAGVVRIAKTLADFAAFLSRFLKEQIRN